jgi:y4mF family transcriptional regulator
VGKEYLRDPRREGGLIDLIDIPEEVYYGIGSNILYPFRYDLICLYYICTPKGIVMRNPSLSEFVKQQRKAYNLTQVELSEKSGVGLRFVRELEQGKQTLRLDKVNQLLSLFGAEVGVVPIQK